MKKVFITGATGFIGMALLRKLLEEDFNVTVLARHKEAFPGDILSTVQVIEGDAIDIVSLTKDLPKDYDVFYHLAWQGVTPEHRNDLEIQMSNVQLSTECVKAAAQLEIPKFIFLGSTMQYIYYGYPINEKAIPSSSNFYGAAKIAAHYISEELARQLGVGFIYAVTTSVYGVGREDKNVLFYVIDKLLNLEKPSVTKLEQKWDYIHIDDLTQALCIIGKSGKNGAFYSIGNGDNKPLATYLEIVRNIIDPNLPLGIGEVPYSKGKIPSSCIDLTRLKKDTGFLPRIPFEEGITDVINYYREIKRGINQ